MNLLWLGAGFAGLLLAGVPLVVHLISRRRARVIEFAPIAFVLKSQKRTARDIRLRQILLLVVRTLFIAALALAVMRPVLRPADQAEKTGPSAVMYALDESASMWTQTGDQTVYERAVARLQERLGDEKDDVAVGLVACGARPEVLVAPGFDRALVREAVDGRTPGYAPATLAPCLSAAADAFGPQSGPGGKLVVVLSDLFAPALASTDQRGAAPGVTFEWVDLVGDDAPRNRSLSAPEVAAARGQEAALTFRFTVRATGQGAAPEDSAVDLFYGRQRLARTVLPTAPGAEVQGTFTHTFAADDEKVPSAALVLSGEDALPADDRIEIPLTPGQRLKVLVVDGAPDAVPYRDEVYYLENALRQVRLLRSRVSYEVIGPEQLGPGPLADTRVLILANVASLPARGAAAVVEFVRAGGGLLLSAGDQLDVDWTNANLGPVLPGALRGAKGQALLDDAQVAQVLGLHRFSAAHPVFAGLDATEGFVRGLSRVRTHTTMLIEPSADAPREVLVRFTNGTPALVERRVGDGRAIVLLTSLDRDWSDLCIRPGFLPLVQQLLAHLAGLSTGPVDRFTEVGTPHRLGVPTGFTVLEVLNPEGEAAPTLAGDDPAVQTYVPAVPGLHTVRGRRGEGEPVVLDKLRFFALFPASESDLTPATQDALTQAVPSGAAVKQSEREADERLWPWLLLLAGLMFVLEALVLQRR